MSVYHFVETITIFFPKTKNRNSNIFINQHAIQNYKQVKALTFDEVIPYSSHKYVTFCNFIKKSLSKQMKAAAARQFFSLDFLG